MSMTQRGFTLIELIIVIVILGILAAVGIPKIVDLERQARIAKVKAMAGAISSGATLLHSKAILSGADVEAQSTNMTLGDGTTLALVYGFPDRRDASTMTWIVQDMGDFTYTGNSGRYTLPGTQCTITYKNAKRESGPSVTLSQQCQ
ncbi:MAG: prepilin-type N-terminal cleavage/methylation domain-containing protein [Pseudomonadota bacterium]